MPLSLSQNTLSLSLLDDGAWFALEPWLARSEIRLAANETEPAVRLRAWSSPKFRDVMEECRKEHNPLGSAQSAAAVDAAVNHAIARGLITGLRGDIEWRGKPAMSDEKSLRAMLDDRQHPQLLNICIAASQSVANYREQVEERRAGN